MTHATSLPAADTLAAFDAIARDEQALRPGVEALCRSQGLDTAGLVRFPAGSLPVYGVDNRVLKLFPPVQLGELAVETGALAAVRGRLPVSTPGLDATGLWNGWGFLVMERLRGTRLKDVWPQVALGERRELAWQTGDLVAALHGVAPPALPDWPRGDWPAFVAQQRTTAVARHAAWGLSAEWLEQLPEFLDSVVLKDDQQVLLHTDVLPANLMAMRDDGTGAWRLSGLFDFEQAMRGTREYEFVAIGVFLTEGDPESLLRVLSAYGYGEGDLDHELSRRLMAWTLLHSHGDLVRFFGHLPKPAVPTFDGLAESWFGIRID